MAMGNEVSRYLRTVLHNNEKSLFKTGRLQGRLQKLGLEFSKPFLAHPTLYQSCVRYTIVARLAPSWNKAGEWYIQGRDFVAHHGCTNATKMNLCVNKTEIFITITGTVVRFPPLQVDDLNLSRHEMLQILKSTQEGGGGGGSQVELQDSWCYVLPSMKRGRIISVSLQIPSESPFSSYKDLKRYWKNTYGYRLPETDEDILYCQVSFLSSGGGKQFTYPDVCLRNQPVQLKTRVDCKSILASFLQDIHARIGHVCGQPLRFTPKMHYAAVSLHDANEEIPHASLTNKKKMNGKTPLKSSQTLLQMNQKYSHSKDQPSLLNKLIGSVGANSLPKNTEQQLEKGIRTSDKIDSAESNFLSKNSEEQFEKSGVRKIGDKFDNPCSSQSQQAVQLCSNAGENNPDFKENNSGINEMQNVMLHQGISSTRDSKHSPSKTYQAVSTINDKSTTTTKVTSKPLLSSYSKFVPLFRPQQKSTNSLHVRKLEDTGSINTRFTPVFKSRLQSSSSIVKPVINKSLPIQTIRSNSNSNSSQTKTAQASVIPIFKPKSKSLSNSSVGKSFNQTVSQQITSSKKIPVSDTARPSALLSKCPNPKSLFHVDDNNCDFNFPSMLAHPSKTLPMYKSQLSKTLVGADLGRSLPATNSNLNAAPSTPNSRKRKPELGTKSNSDTPKKARSKPQVQNLDIEALAKTNELKKANALTLMTWLKERGINCKSKDQKNVLIEKVIAHVKMSLPES